MKKLKIEELRIGNYVQINNNIKKVVCIDYDEITVKDSDLDEIYSIIKVEKIKLTEEWLLKFGFEYTYEIEDAFPFYRLARFMCNEQLQPTDAGFKIAYIDIKYVHQLQNLYFALTGMELKM